jgi:DNA-binding transcriptional regulator YdaS (Cro superfamily)
MKAINRAINLAGGQTELAKKIGVSQPSVHRWTHGGAINARYIKPIAEATGNRVTVDELLDEQL